MTKSISDGVLFDQKPFDSIDNKYICIYVMWMYLYVQKLFDCCLDSLCVLRVKEDARGTDCENEGID